MFSLERFERIIIAVLIAGLLTGLGFAIYKKSIPSNVQLKTFDPGEYRSSGLGTNKSSKININTASADELAGLKGIGQTLAARIVAYRTENGYFISVTDIKKVKGIGEALFDKIKDKIVAE